jgi:hypothetical protein
MGRRGFKVAVANEKTRESPNMENCLRSLCKPRPSKVRNEKKRREEKRK